MWSAILRSITIILIAAGTVLTTPWVFNAKEALGRTSDLSDPSAVQSTMVETARLTAPTAAAAPRDRAILDQLTSAGRHAIFTAAARASGVDAELERSGPLTIFAPTDDAFARLPPDLVRPLLSPEHQRDLVRALRCHIAPTRRLKADLRRMVDENWGHASVTTLGGCALMVTRVGDQLLLSDPRGSVARFSIVDLEGDDVVIHVIDAVMLPQDLVLAGRI